MNGIHTHNHKIHNNIIDLCATGFVFEYVLDACMFFFVQIL